MTVSPPSPLALAQRIVRSGPVDPAVLKPHPMNLRRHLPRQMSILLGIMLDGGEVAPVIVSERTGFLLDGHARRELALKHGFPSLNAVWVDVEPDEELLVLATFDAVSLLAELDGEQQRRTAKAAEPLTRSADLQAWIRSFENTTSDPLGMIVDHTKKLVAGDAGVADEFVGDDPAASVVRQIIFVMDAARYERLVPALLTLINQHDLNDVYDAVVWLLDRQEAAGA